MAFFYLVSGIVEAVDDDGAGGAGDSEHAIYFFNKTDSVTWLATVLHTG